MENPENTNEDTGLTNEVVLPDDADTDSVDVDTPDENLVPRWLAVLVLVLLLAVMLVGGFVIQGLLTRDRRAASPQEIAINSWTEKVKADPNDQGARLGLGYAYQVDGRYDKALEQYAMVLKADPKNTAALYNRGNVYLRLGVSERVEGSMWEVLKIDPTHVLAAKALGDFYAEKGHYKSLIEAVKPAAEAHPEMADLQYLLGMAYEKLNDPVAAARYYNLAVRYSPDMIEAQEGLKRVGARQ